MKVLLDATHDHRTAYVFAVNAGGVQWDGLDYEERCTPRSGTGPGTRRAGSLAEGWAAELAIPLSLLRFPGRASRAGACRCAATSREARRARHGALPAHLNAALSRQGHLTAWRTCGRSERWRSSLTWRRAGPAPFSDPRALAQAGGPLAGRGAGLQDGPDQRPRPHGHAEPGLRPGGGGPARPQPLQRRDLLPRETALLHPGDGAVPAGGRKGGPPTLFYRGASGWNAHPRRGEARGRGRQRVEVGVLDAVVTGPWRGARWTRSSPDRNLGLYLDAPAAPGPQQRAAHSTRRCP